ncbi:MAG: sigma-54-dependent Fis family transcriptional regulator [Spirochaetales bacterium]|nr:sigma-54-dependent Fis family transcriptional regulator [Spirochaetales bacterium]
MKLGAFDYLVKPFTREQLLQALQNAFLQHTLHRKSFSCDALENPLLSGIIGNSGCIQTMKSLLHRYARHWAPVLITGESGTGKDLAADILHRLSDRRHNPFLALNCAAIPDTLIESELFGSEKGAFTDAVTKPGKLECADGGTLFLDEIGDMGLAVQAKLLRCLEDQAFTRVGGVRETRVDVRIVAATNKCLEHLIEKGLFRSDLYYRLRVLTLHIQPLRERKEDIPLLTNHLVQQFPDKAYTLSFEAMEKLINHPWPGNVRELKGVLERAMVHTTTSKIESRHILF